MLATYLTRVLQLIMAVIVLGLSITAAKWQGAGSVPATTAFAAFVGAFGVLVAIIGLIAARIDSIPNLIMAGLDGLTSVLMLAGGIAFAVKLSGIDCGTSDEYHNSFDNELVNGGCVEIRGNTICSMDGWEEVAGRCRTVEADAAFLFLGFLACVAAAVLCFTAQKRGRAV